MGLILAALSVHSVFDAVGFHNLQSRARASLLQHPWQRRAFYLTPEGLSSMIVGMCPAGPQVESGPLRPGAAHRSWVL
jgi:hypothetical protein